MPGKTKVGVWHGQDDFGCPELRVIHAVQSIRQSTSKTTLIEYHMVENLTVMSFDLLCSKPARSVAFRSRLYVSFSEAPARNIRSRLHYSGAPDGPLRLGQLLRDWVGRPRSA
jgi:hypothetical protein